MRKKTQIFLDIKAVKLQEKNIEHSEIKVVDLQENKQKIVRSTS